LLTFLLKKFKISKKEEKPTNKKKKKEEKCSKKRKKEEKYVCKSFVIKICGKDYMTTQMTKCISIICEECYLGLIIFLFLFLNPLIKLVLLL
jgi:hypothetical protein